MSFSNAYNAIRMAAIEMDVVSDLEKMKPSIEKHLDRCFYYFGKTDGWVPLEYAKTYVKTFPNIDHQID